MASTDCHALRSNRWGSLLNDATNAPTQKSASRVLVVPVVVGVVVIVLLAVASPPFVCDKSSGVNAARLLVWGGIAAFSTALLTWHGTLSHFAT